MRPVNALVCFVILLSLATPSLLAQQAAEPPSRDVLDSVVELIRSGDADLLPVALEKVRGGLKGEDFTRELAEVVLPDLERSQDQAAHRGCRRTDSIGQAENGHWLARPALGKGDS